MKLNKRERIIILSALLIAASVLFINFIYFPMKEDIRELEAQSSQLNSQISDAKAKAARMESLMVKKEQLKEEIDAKDDHILEVWDQPSILYFIEKTTAGLAKSKSITIYNSLGIGGIQSGETTFSINIGYQDLKKLWKKFEKAEYYTTVKSFSIEKTGETGALASENKEELTAEITLRLYAQGMSDKAIEEKEYDFMKGSFGKTNIYQ